MKLIMAIVRPSKVEEIKDSLSRLNIAGMTITEVRGHGRQKGHTAIYRGKEYSVSLLPKMKVEVVIPDDFVEETIQAIIEYDPEPPLGPIDWRWVEDAKIGPTLLGGVTPALREILAGKPELAKKLFP